MYSDEYLKNLMESYTKQTVFPLDENDEDNQPVFTQPTFKEPVLSTENDYEEVLKKPLPENNIKLAELSKDVYNDPDNRLKEWDEYILKPKYSNKFISTYVKNGNIIFAIRGTKEIEDLVLDLETPSSILLNKRFKTLLEIVNKSIKDFKSEFGEVTFTGHSLGGLLSQMMGKEIIDSKAITFNAATAPWLQQGKTKRIKNFRIIGDPISKMKTFGKQINLRPKVPTDKMTKQYSDDKTNIKIPHSIEQFIDRKILEDDPNIHTKKRFEYYSNVAMAIIKAGFYTYLLPKLIPYVARYSSSFGNQVELDRNIDYLNRVRQGVTAGPVLDYMNEFGQGIDEEQAEITQSVVNYVSSLTPVRAYKFVTGILLIGDSYNPLKPISDILADAFEEGEDEEEN